MDKKTYWKEVWERKGKDNTNDLTVLDGYDHTVASLEQIANNIKMKLKIREEDSVLEVGCGAGGMAQFMTCNYVGVDYSKSLIKRHIELFGNSVLWGEANNLIFKDKSFDKVFCYGVFQYFPSTEYAFQVIEEMKRVAKQAIFIGDLPIISHRDEHQLYDKRDFKGWILEEGDYNPNRFNGLYIIK